MICPHCKKEECVKNGHIYNGKQRFLCRSCKRQFVEEPKKRVITQEEWRTIDWAVKKVPSLSIPDLSKVMKISRVSIYKRIRKMKAQKVSP